MCSKKPMPQDLTSHQEVQEGKETGIFGHNMQGRKGDYFQQELAALEVQTHQALALLEATIPRSEMVIMIHLMGHLPHQILKFGPIRQHWMYPLESFFGVLKGSVDYRKIPEAAIMTRYCMMKTVQNLELAVESSKGIHKDSEKFIGLL